LGQLLYRYEGYVWGANWVTAYPGFSPIKNSAKALAWTQKLNKPMQEVQVEADIIRINLIFNNWDIKKLNEETGLISQFFFPFGE
jgi:hypothetical protein